MIRVVVMSSSKNGLYAACKIAAQPDKRHLQTNSLMQALAAGIFAEAIRITLLVGAHPWRGQ
jgi:hypothetical protein